jgi:hypothetical protein
LLREGLTKYNLSTVDSVGEENIARTNAQFSGNA